MPTRASIPSTTDGVKEILEQEFALRVTLERGLMNRQALCRWLIKHYDLDAGVDAIDQVLRDWDGTITEGPLQAAREAFATGSAEHFLLLNEGDVGTALQILEDLKQSIPGPDEE